MTDSARESIGILIFYIGFGFLYYAVYLALCEVIDVIKNPLGVYIDEEVKPVKKEPKNLFETDKVFWDMVIAGSFVVWIIMVVGAITVVAL